jgi:hypothetical protein
MQEGYFYIVKDCFFEMFLKSGSVFKFNKDGNRPTFCCMKDKLIDGLFWAIPTSNGEVNENNIAKFQRIEFFVNLPPEDIRCHYYHFGETNRKAIFCISSAFPITDKYIERAYTSQGHPLKMEKENMKNDIIKKLLKILSYENQFQNKFEQKITYMKKVLIDELKEEQN